MLLVANNYPTSRGTPDDIAKLQDCDWIFDYHECGWYVVTGRKDGVRIVHAHFSSVDEFERMKDASKRFKSYQ